MMFCSTVLPKITSQQGRCLLQAAFGLEEAPVSGEPLGGAASGPCPGFSAGFLLEDVLAGSLRRLRGKQLQPVSAGGIVPIGDRFHSNLGVLLLLAEGRESASSPWCSQKPVNLLRWECSHRTRGRLEERRLR